MHDIIEFGSVSARNILSLSNLVCRLRQFKFNTVMLVFVWCKIYIITVSRMTMRSISFSDPGLNLLIKLGLKLAKQFYFVEVRVIHK